MQSNWANVCVCVCARALHSFPVQCKVLCKMRDKHGKHSIFYTWTDFNQIVSFIIHVLNHSHAEYPHKESTVESKNQPSHSYIALSNSMEIAVLQSQKVKASSLHPIIQTIWNMWMRALVLMCCCCWCGCAFEVERERERESESKRFKVSSSFFFRFLFIIISSTTSIVISLSHSVPSNTCRRWWCDRSVRTAAVSCYTKNHRTSFQAIGYGVTFSGFQLTIELRCA